MRVGHDSYEHKGVFLNAHHSCNHKQSTKSMFVEWGGQDLNELLPSCHGPRLPTSHVLPIFSKRGLMSWRLTDACLFMLSDFSSEKLWQFILREQCII